MIKLFMYQLSCLDVWFFFSMDLLACQFVCWKPDSAVYSAVLNRTAAWGLKPSFKVQPSVGFLPFPPQIDQIYNPNFLFQPDAFRRDILFN